MMPWFVALNPTLDISETCSLHSADIEIKLAHLAVVLVFYDLSYLDLLYLYIEEESAQSP